MGDLPPYASLSGTRPAELYGLVAAGAEAALEASYDVAWQKDRALLEVIDAALRAAAEGRTVGDAARPRWLDGLVARELRTAATRFWSRESFGRVRLLERLGLVGLEPDDTYVLAMISSLGPTKAATLRADPELVAGAFWRLFEVEGGGEVSLANVDRFGGDEWRAAVLELSADGTVERPRVLTACLAALGRDFAAYRAGWFSATYLALEPTDDEVAASQADLRRLLGAPVPATVSFALKLLGRVHKAGRLEAEETLELLPPATVVRAKGTALAALRIARDLRAEHPAAVVVVAQTALGHPHADVQRAATALLEECGRGDVVVAAADDLSPAVRQEVGLGATVAEPVEGRPVQRLAEPATPVAPDDLAERMAALLEDASDAAELEAVIAACAGPDAGRRLAPLRKRAREVVARGPRTMLGDEWLPGHLARVVLAALDEPVSAAEPDLPAQRFVVRRLAELGEGSAPLLATPDLPGGWVSAGALVERLARSPRPRHHDLVAALLRLHPEGREEGVVDGVQVPAAVGFALHGTEPPRRLLRSGREGPAAWWRAAERSRAPYAGSELPELTGDVRTHTWHDGGRERTSRSVRFAVTTSTARTGVDDQPTELPARTSDQWGGGGVSRSLGDWIPTLAAIWPHDAEHFLALTCVPVLESPSWSETAHDVPRTIDALAQHPGRTGALAAATLAAGISATQRDHRLHGADAFLDLVASGRVPSQEVAVVLSRYAQAWPANRWAESLAQVASAPGGAEACAELLTHLLPRLPSDHRGLAKLLDLLRDQQVRLGRPVTDAALTRWLGDFSGSSAAARTARLLLG